MQFEISHEFDAPIDAVELAIMSPELGPLLVESSDGFESVEVMSHEIGDDQFRRVWRFQARAPLKILQSYEITREMMSWEEHSTYTRANRTAEWHVVPMGDESDSAPWRGRFSSGGSYRLDALAEGRTRRTVIGEMVIGLRMIGRMVERIAIREVKKAYDAEAEAIRKLSQLG